ncbi:hypothetical protein CBR_g34606 [Chara braunii]|uniref:RRM domain-containing protein n=1 Tax=Chara braunii TaxID=69332 RepID=A0A388LJA3_CHABU|nr:hypothetical protein CBR_g34606 [Chara braunii]|eukprot:GBG82323.1 hypothetical protein CBR_g34606 [Chara braunii]
MSHKRHRIFLKSGVTGDVTEHVLENHFRRYGVVTDVYIPKDPVSKQSRGFGFVTFTKEEAINVALEMPVHRIQGRDIPVGRADPRPPDRGGKDDRHYRSEYGRSRGHPMGMSNGGHSGLPPFRAPNDYLALPPPPEVIPLPHMPPVPTYFQPSFSELDVPHSGFHNNAGEFTSYGPPPQVGGVPPLTVDSKFFRIFVGGVPDAITESDMKAHFERYGQVKDVYFPTDRVSGRRRGFCYVRFTTMHSAEAAAARSPRTISGHDIGEIKVAQPRPPENGPLPLALPASQGMPGEGMGRPFRGDGLIVRGPEMFVGPRPIREPRNPVSRYHPY